MKHSRILLVAALLFMAVNGSMAQVITSSCSKNFYITYICADYDTDGSLSNNDLYELAEPNHYLTLDYTDMGSAGNTMTVQFSDRFAKNFTNVTFEKSVDNDSTIYTVTDSTGDMILRTIFDNDAGKWLLFVFNISILEKFTK